MLPSPCPPLDFRLHRLPVPGPVSSIRYCKRDHVRKAVVAAGLNVDSVLGLAGPSDLTPGKYEGGFKVWESTTDLLQWISEEAAFLENKSVLDLGCGAGLLGIACLLSGAAQVTFHDFNEAVIDFFTQANVLLNCPNADGHLPTNAFFASGDWNDYHPKPFDVIVSSETIYDEKNYKSVLSLLKRSLKADGTALISAKSHYFGVGGGTRSFERFVEEDKYERVMDIESIRLIPAPVQREILKLQWK